jgi:energy-coupling factor transporter ATP-binding protein EcfA2/2-polyprenyl-3-methyl-5-hydroxy-6-metoxy-1,4-benzoquinol methylase
MKQAISVFRGSELIGSFDLERPGPGSTKNIILPDSLGVSVVLRAVCGARTVGDGGFRVTSDRNLVDSPLWDDALYLGPFSRYTFSWRASTVVEEVLTSVRPRNLPAELHFRTAQFLLGMFHLDHLALSEPSTLSGGEAQRLALLLAVVNREGTIVIDHALSEQDRRHSALLEIFLQRFSSLIGISILHRRAAADLRSGGYGANEKQRSGTLLRADEVDIRSAGRRLCAVDTVRIDCGSITLVVGDNGAGKSLLCRYLIGELPTGVGGSARMHWADGTRASQAYVNQDVTLGFSHASSREELSSVSDRSVGLFCQFPGFTASDLEVSPFELTTDKQKLLAVVKALGQGKNMIILDEPSEYWDDAQAAYAIRMFEAYVSEGHTILIATHDRRMLESDYPRICLVASNTRRSLELKRGITTPNGFTPKIAGKEYMYKAWQALHERWPNSTLELFENWHDNVDDVLRAQIRIIAETRSAANYLDLGCGNGLQTLWLRSQLASSGIVVRTTMGIEWQEHAIDWANYWASDLSDVAFSAMDIDLALNRPELAKRFDIMSSLFVLHDLPHASDHIAQVFSALSERGVYLSCLLNPEWVNERRDSLFASDQDLPVPNDADFARDYRLPEAPDGDLGLPYFHRSIDRYKEAFARAGFRRVETAFSEASSQTPSGSSDEPQTVAFLAFK